MRNTPLKKFFGKSGHPLKGSYTIRCDIELASPNGLRASKSDIRPNVRPIRRVR